MELIDICDSCAWANAGCHSAHFHPNGMQKCGDYKTVLIEPSSDAVEVVRCKDCVFSRPNDGKLVEGARYCSITFSGTLNELTSVWDVDYCSNGKRKEVE